MDRLRLKLPMGLGPKAGRSRTASAPGKPRRMPQLLVWVFVLTVFGGLALLSSQYKQAEADHTPTRAQVVAVQKELREAAAQPSAGSGSSGSTLLAAGSNSVLQQTQPPADGQPDECSRYNEQRDFLPLYRWTSFELFTVDDAWLIKTKLMSTALANLMFMVASLCWRIIAVLMGIGYSFDMICTAAKPLNDGVQFMVSYASYALIPAWLVVLFAAFRRWNKSSLHGQGHSHWHAFKLVMVFLIMTGLIFFIGDQAKQNQNNPLDKYTLPWAAATVQGWFGQVGSGLATLDLNSDVGQESPIFYDNGPKSQVGAATCAGMDKALYKQYLKDNASSSVADGRGAMKQLSQIWELSLVRSYIIAQFGEGSQQYPSPAHAACHLLEQHSDVSPQSKSTAYDLSIGKPGATKPGSLRAYYLNPPEDNVSTIAWGACMNNGDGTDKDGHDMPVLKYWEGNTSKNKEQACGALYSDQSEQDATHSTVTDPQTGTQITTSEDPKDLIHPLTFANEDDLHNTLDDCLQSQNQTKANGCRQVWSFLDSYLGANETDRITQGLVSLAVAVVFLFTLGPMAAGLTISSVALSVLVMLFPIALLLLAMGMQQGKKMVKITGALAASKLFLMLALTFLSTFTSVTIFALDKVVGTGAPSFIQQIAEGAAPLVALLILKKGAKLVGIGDLSTMSGALSFAGASALSAVGEKDAAQKFTGLNRGLGIGKATVGALDQRSLQSRLFNNRLTRGAARGAGELGKTVGSKAGKAVGHGAAAGARGLAQTKAGQKAGQLAGSAANVAGVAAQKTGAAAAWRGITSNDPKARFIRNMALTAGLAGLAGTGVGALPALAAAGLSGVAQIPNGQAAWADLKRRRGGDGAAPGVPFAANARQELDEAKRFNKATGRISDRGAAQGLQAERTVNALNNHRAKEWGFDLDGGFESEAIMEAAAASKAAELGMDRKDMIVTPSGLWVPKAPMYRNRVTGERVVPPNLPPDVRDHPYYSLPERVTERGPEESDEQYGTRMVAELVARGAITESGDLIRRSELPGTLTITNASSSPTLNRMAVSAARDWSAEQSAWRQDPLNGINAINLDSATRAVDAQVPDARAVIRQPLNQIEAPLPGGGTAQVGQIRQEFERKLREATHVAEQTARLHEESRPSSPAAVERFDRQRESLATQQQAIAREIEDLSNSLSEALGSVAAARNVCGTRASMPTWSGQMGESDAAEIRQAVERLHTQMQKALDDQEDELRTMLSSLSRAREDGNGARDLEQDIAKIDRRFNDWIHDAEIANREVEQLMYEAERRAQAPSSDPRSRSSSLNHGRALVKMHTSGRTRNAILERWNL